MATEGVLTALAVKAALAGGLAIAASFAARRFQHGRGALPRGERHLRVLETTSVGQQRALHLVAIGDPARGGQVLLIASTPNQITFLAPAELPPAAAQEEAEKGPRFEELLRGLLPGTARPAPSLSSALQSAAQRLRGEGVGGAAR